MYKGVLLGLSSLSGWLVILALYVGYPTFATTHPLIRPPKPPCLSDFARLKAKKAKSHTFEILT